MSFNKRVKKVNEELNKKNLEGIYITNLTNVRYLTGFTGSAGSVLILDNINHFFTDGRYIEQSKEQVKNCKIHIVGGNYFKYIADNNLIKERLNIGFESEHISVSLFKNLCDAINNIQWIQCEGIVEKIAAVKDQLEIQSLKTAIQITDEVFTQIIPELKVGATEKDISAKISYLFKMNGAEGDSYESIIGSGWLGALPHARPTDKKFESGDFVVMDFGALYNGYHADMTRTVVIGKASDKHKEIYNIVLESQLAGIKKAKAGITGAEVDNACRTVINQAGYGDKFIHSTGHGIGLEVHTYPRISSINKKALLENYVITIEPGIYLEGWGGVRIEDDCLINKNSCTPLNKSTKEMLVL
jgi:Xaa-Pro aminopeptidase